MGWLKRMLPRGLYGRAALILFLPVVVVTLVVTVMFLQRHFEDVTRQMVRSAAAELALIADRVEGAADIEAARAAGNEIAVPLGLTLELPAPEGLVEARRFYDLSGRVVISALHAAVPAVETVDLRDIDGVSVFSKALKPRG